MYLYLSYTKFEEMNTHLANRLPDSQHRYNHVVLSELGENTIKFKTLVAPQWIYLLIVFDYAALI
jgi:hypothetical protein